LWSKAIALVVAPMASAISVVAARSWYRIKVFSGVVVPAALRRNQHNDYFKVRTMNIRVERTLK
jgi:hypothetical protein